MAVTLSSPLVETGADIADFDAFVRSERDRAVALAYHLVGDRAAAEDVAQDAFVRAHQAWGSFRGDASRRTWFTRILVNRARSFRRWRGVRQRFLSKPAGDTASEGRRPDAAAIDQQLRERIARSLDGLSARQREAFALVHLGGLTVNAAADAMGVATGTLKSHLHRALAALRRDLVDLMEEHDG